MPTASFSRGLFGSSPLGSYFEFEFACAKPLILFLQETSALKDGVLSLLEHTENGSLSFQCLDTLPQGLTHALGFCLETKDLGQRLQVLFQSRVYRRPDLHVSQILYQQKLTDYNQLKCMDSSAANDTNFEGF